MAGISKKKGSNMWHATFRVHGKRVMRSTKVPISSPDESSKSLKERAKAQANSMERLARGETPLSREIDALRAAAAVSGVAAKMPTVEDYLTSFRMDCRESTQNNKKRAFALFLAFLKDGASRRLDAVTPRECQDFLASLEGRMTTRTVETVRQHVSSAFNRAINEDLLTKNPMRGQKIIGIGDDSINREALTREDIEYLLLHAPAPWPDMVLLSVCTAGQRLGDIACLKWDRVDFGNKRITITTMKTHDTYVYRMTDRLIERLLFLREHAGDSPYVFPDMAAAYIRSASHVSTEFTSMLLSFRIATRIEVKRKDGSSRWVANKSFHGLRRYVVTTLRENGVSADMSRKLVGHKSELVEQAYFASQEADKEKAMKTSIPDSFFDCINGSVSRESED